MDFTTRTRLFFIFAALLTISSLVSSLGGRVSWPPVKRGTPVENLDLSSIYAKSFRASKTYKRPTNEIGKVLGTVTKVGPELPEKPVDPNRSLLIPKLKINAPIIFDVPVDNQQAYHWTLNQGLAHADSSSKPSPNDSNTHLIAHANNPEDPERYATTFKDLDQLYAGDLLVLFYNGERYDYRVQNYKILPGCAVFTSPSKADASILTLQTCLPVKNPKSRLLVIAKLQDIYQR